MTSKVAAVCAVLAALVLVAAPARAERVRLTLRGGAFGRSDSGYAITPRCSVWATPGWAAAVWSRAESG